MLPRPERFKFVAADCVMAADGLNAGAELALVYAEQDEVRSEAEAIVIGLLSQTIALLEESLGKLTHQENTE